MEGKKLFMRACSMLVAMCFLLSAFTPVRGWAKEDRPAIFIGPEYKSNSASYVLMNADDGAMVLGKNPYEVRPIASLTKLMTAMVALDSGFDFSRNVEYSHARHYAYRNYMGLVDGDVLENRDLWVAMLVGSLNVPARMIVDSLGISEAEFVKKMNEKAVELGLEDVHFVDVHGLSPENVGSAVSVGKMFRAVQEYSEIVRALAIRKYEFDETVSIDARFHHQFAHTNRMVNDVNAVPTIISKTGYLYEAGSCLVFLTTVYGEDRVVVTLGDTQWLRRHEDGYALAQWWKGLSQKEKTRGKTLLVKYADSEKVYEMTAQGLAWIPDESTFIKKGYRWSEVMEIGARDRFEIAGVRVP